MIIKKIYNNNVVLAVEGKSKKEVILTGCGIGFQKKIEQEVDESKIEKRFVIDDEEFRQKIDILARDIDEAIFRNSSSIIEHAEKALSTNLDEYIYISLTDHIAFALKRYREDLLIKNDLLYEIRRIHKQEFEIGKWAVEYLNKEHNTNFDENEAGFIAMHIVNANYKQSKNSLLTTNIIKEILNIIRYYYGVDFKEDDINYDRLMTHLKFFSKRLLESNTPNKDKNDLLEIIKLKYVKEFNCSCKIKTFIEEKYNYYVSEDELLYLTLHINRVISVMNSK